jgi:hypothetical protein
LRKSLSSYLRHAEVYPAASHRNMRNSDIRLTMQTYDTEEPYDLSTETTIRLPEFGPWCRPTGPTPADCVRRTRRPGTVARRRGRRGRPQGELVEQPSTTWEIEQKVGTASLELTAAVRQIVAGTSTLDEDPVWASAARAIDTLERYLNPFRVNMDVRRRAGHLPVFVGTRGPDEMKAAAREIYQRYDQLLIGMGWSDWMQYPMGPNRMAQSRGPGLGTEVLQRFEEAARILVDLATAGVPALPEGEFTALGPVTRPWGDLPEPEEPDESTYLEPGEAMKLWDLGDLPDTARRKLLARVLKTGLVRIQTVTAKKNTRTRVHAGDWIDFCRRWKKMLGRRAPVTEDDVVARFDEIQREIGRAADEKRSGRPR